MAEDGVEQTAGNATRDVFVSYASQDAAVANAVVEGLEQAGIRCWIAPRDVVPGEFYADAIVHAIDATQATVLILSAAAAASPHVLREVERTTAKRHPVVSVRIDRTPLPAALEYFLNTSQWLDASELGVGPALPKLVDGVRRAAAPAPDRDRPAAHGLPGSAAPDAAQLATIAHRARRPARAVLVLAAVIAAAVAVWVVGRYWASRNAAERVPVAATAAVATGTSPAAPAISARSVAVLPFVDMSEKKDQGYFSDGLSEELIDRLTKMPGLRVAARTSSFYFKGKQATIAEIASALGVAHVLEGSVRQSGRTLRVTAQLIRADGGYHIWSETFDRPVGDIFKIQDEIANAVVHALKVSVLDAERSPTAPRPNLEAYLLYLQSILIGEGNGPTDFDAASGRLRAALRIDPGFAAAWSALALTLVWRVEYDGSPTPALCAEAHDAVARALKSEPASSEAHRAMGNVLRQCDSNLDGAAAEFRRVLELDPGNSLTLKDYAWLVMDGFGRADEGRQLAERAVALDPLNPWHYEVLGMALMNLGRLADAEAAYRRAIALVPAAADLHTWLALILMLNHQPAKAVEEIKLEPNPDRRGRVLAFALDAAGRAREADAEIRRFEATRAADEPEALAEFYACRGDADRAMPWLQRAVARKIDVIRDPPYFRDCLAKIAGDARYQALQRQMPLPK